MTAEIATDLVLAEALASRLTRINVLLRRNMVLSGLSVAQARTLATLRDFGPRRITELADLEQVAQPTMSALVARLERQGWVERHPDAEDRRVVVIGLTETGRAALRDITAVRTRILDAHLQALSGDERAALAAAVPALDKILHHAQAHEVAHT